ncbi:hypothetical protein NPIL_581841 [Nephila pilipes]|uniref:Uncharacterized protein n=1 Tax=Nephila pilipes TaxID=299642 RepID=A0A8X6PN60_NEPPI|nr:hypothetical protein NPIL_581841 [Nephila pilipes]
MSQHISCRKKSDEEHFTQREPRTPLNRVYERIVAQKMSLKQRKRNKYGIGSETASLRYRKELLLLTTNTVTNSESSNKE